MFRKILIIVMLVIPVFVFAQTGYILYRSMDNGKPVGRTLPVVYNNGMAQLNPESKSKEKSYVDYTNKETIQLVETGDDQFIGIKAPFDNKIELKHENSDLKILGYPTKKATYVINSNTIEVYYNENIKIKGTPGFRQLPQLGTILKVITNGNRVMEAVEIKEAKIQQCNIEFPSKY